MTEPVRAPVTSASGGRSPPERLLSFDAWFRREFSREFAWVFRYVDRCTGDAALASDVAQETFIRLYERGSLPEDVRAWLATVANNLVRDEHRKSTRRARLVGRRAPEHTMGDPAPEPDQRLLSEDIGVDVRRALDRMSARDRRLVLLREEGLSYRELAAALGLEETSVGTLLARARAAFRAAVGVAHAR